jgi:hypothetical protein
VRHIALISALGACAVSAGAGARAVEPPSISWAPHAGGHRHGWAAEPVVVDKHHIRWRCTPKARRGDQQSIVCATDDAGKHWRTAFERGSSWRLGGPGPSLLDLLRWSRQAGVISLPLSTDSARGHREYWTRDGGRHWWRTSVFNAGADEYCDANASSGVCVEQVDMRREYGRIAFTSIGWVITPGATPSQAPTWTRNNEEHLLLGWPPRGQITCPVGWSGPPGRRICHSPVADGLSAEDVPRSNVAVPAVDED